MSSTVSRAVTVSTVIIATVVVFYVLVVGEALLKPFALAVMIWYIINALSRFYGRWLLRGKSAANGFTLALALITIAVAAALVVDLVQGNLSQVSAAVPTYKANFERILATVLDWLNLGQLPSLNQLVGSFDLAPLVSKFIAALTAILGNTGLIFIYILFLLVEQKTFDRKLNAMIADPERRQSIERLLSHMQSDIQTYISIKTLTSLATGILSYLILIIVGVDYAEFWGFTIFMLNYIPTIGSIVATVFPALLALIQFDTVYPFAMVAVGLTVVQVLIGNLVEPKLMGSSLNLSPLVVLLSLVLWGSVWGIVGMFLSVPITVMIMIVLAQFPQTRPIAVLLSSHGRLKSVGL